MASLMVRVVTRRRKAHVKQPRFLNQKLGKRISRKSELQRAKLETARAFVRQMEKK